MKITSPSGRTYNWDKPNPPTEDDIAALQAYDARLTEQEAVRAKAPAAPEQQAGLGARIMGALGAVKDKTDYRNVPGSGALTASTEMGMGGLTPDEVQQASGTAMKQMGMMAIRAGPPTIGQMVAGPAGGAILGGAGELAAQAIEGGPIRPGAIAGAATVGAIPLGPLAGTGMRGVVREGVKQAAGNVVARNVQTGIDEGRAATLGENAVSAAASAVGTGLAKGIDAGAVAAATALKAAQDATRRETLRIGKELGYVIPPSVIRPSLATDTLNSIGGKAATAQEAIRRNQPITNQAIREELKLPPNTAFSDQSLNVARIVPNKAYADAAAVSPQAKIMLDEFKQAQANANQAFANYRNMPKKDPSVLEIAKKHQTDADDAFARLEREAVSNGKPDIGKKLQEARVTLAKIGLVQDALNKGDGNISAKVIGDAYAAGEKLSGNLEKIGRFQNAFWQSVKDAADTPPSGVNQLMQYVAPATGALLGKGMGGYPGAAAAMAAMMGTPRGAREVMLSRLYQNQFLRPNYGAERADVPAMVAQLAAQSAGRQPTQPRPIPYR
jgi:hypothetical protein